MVTSSFPKFTCRFGPFVLDLRTGDLTRNGRRVHLQEQPRSLLLALAQRPGELVSRRELHKKLWPGDTFVDFEDGLNGAVSKLREAIGDDPKSPRYIETVRKRGYRLVGTIESFSELAVSEATDPGDKSPEKASVGTSANESIHLVAAPQAGLSASARRDLFKLALVVFGVALVLTAGIDIWWLLPEPPPRMVRLRQITTGGRIDYRVKPVTDGARVFYLERDGGHWTPMEASIEGGEPQPMPGLAFDTRVMDVSPDGSTFLLGSFTSRSSGNRLSLMPVQGGAPVLLGDIVSGEAVFTPDGQRVLYAKLRDLWTVAANGTDAHLLVKLTGGLNWLAWSPDGTRLRLTVGDDEGGTALWEVRRDGSNPHRVFQRMGPTEHICCGEWTPDGRYYIYSETRGGVDNLWAAREPGWHWRRAPRGPFQLTDLPNGAWGAHIGPDGRSVLFYAGWKRAQVEKVNLPSGKISALAPQGLTEPEFSQDGRYVVLVDSNSGALWKVDTQSGQRVRLSLRGFWPVFPRWSPDGRWLATTVSRNDRGTTVYLVPAAGGMPKPLFADERSSRDPDWSPDGKSIVLVHGARDAEDGLFVVDVASGTEKMVPRSEGRYFPHWSSSGRYISAYSELSHGVDFFDFETGKWRTAVSGPGIGFPSWSQDGRFLYYQEMLKDGEPVYRYDPASNSTVWMTDFKQAMADGAVRCSFFGQAPDGDLLVEFNRGEDDLYRADLDFP
ncbi:MAG TPA: winged helix-turn-helix domain-containing protein [Acidobacteriaceae bacterium]|nr:winged helix-turn-helix domain-containing protein [Acidobacteriaceae bacterium]